MDYTRYDAMNKLIFFIDTHSVLPHHIRFEMVGYALKAI